MPPKIQAAEYLCEPLARRIDSLRVKPPMLFSRLAAACRRPSLMPSYKNSLRATRDHVKYKLCIYNNLRTGGWAG